MTAHFPHRSLLAAMLACALGAAFTVRVAHAETPLGVSSLSEAKSNYQHDLAACRNHTVSEDKKTCMLEAQRAYADARQEAMRHGRSGSRQASTDTSADSAMSSGTSAPKADRN
ncbi:MAG TPA: hypothetical protein VJ743_14900 [Albitalea sp.]|nr:hypothetical protein [Albitalea sp.]